MLLIRLVWFRCNEVYCSIYTLAFVSFTQLASLKKLEGENQESADHLEEIVNKGEKLMSQIQEVLHDIAECQLRCQALVSNT